jgi:hypothetical protein
LYSSDGNQASRDTGKDAMTNANLEAFRSIAAEMIGTADWQWIGPQMSQRMFGITRDGPDVRDHELSQGGPLRAVSSI